MSRRCASSAQCSASCRAGSAATGAGGCVSPSRRTAASRAGVCGRAPLRSGRKAPAISGSGCGGRWLACPPGPAVLIGADIPAVEAPHIADAFRLLGRHDLVFGPAADGGFWLVGARRSPRLPPLFGKVRWSGPHALADVLGNLPRRVSVGFAARLEDVDDAAALRRLAPRRLF